MTLQGKTVVVTGGSRGLGRAMALACAREGGDVGITGRARGAMAETARQIRELGRRCVEIELEVTDSAAVTRAAGRFWSELGPVDVLFNNAGSNFFKPALDTTDEEWARVLDVNLTGVFYACRAFGRRMKERGRGKIVNISSEFGVRGDANWAAYAAAKGGVIVLSKSLAWEWAPAVTVNVIAPGAFYTDLTRPMLDQDFVADIVRKATPLGRWAQPEEIGPLAVLLAGPGSDYMTGTVIRLDGGIVRS